jgi:uncharacterized membrane protein YkvI
MDFLKCLKTSAVFIGTLIGAGFATGREISLYFGNSSPSVPIFAALLSGVFCALFLLAGRWGLNVIPTKGGRLMLSLFSIAAFIIYAAMISGAEELLYDSLGLKFGGFITAVIIAAICLASPEGLKNLNIVAVPAITLLVAVLFMRSGDYALPRALNFHNAFAYTALNIFLGGFLIVPDGKKMIIKEIIMTGVLTAIFIGIIIFTVYYLILFSPASVMPSVEAARHMGLELIATAVVFLAIISTMAGCFTALAAIVNTSIKSKRLSSFIVISAGTFAALIGFKYIVNYGYPIVSIIGTVYTVSLIAAIIRGRVKRPPLLLPESFKRS